MSLELSIGGIKEIKAQMVDVEAYSDLSWATWHDAIPTAPDKYAAKRIGILTPFDKKGNDSAFGDQGGDLLARFTGKRV